MAKTKTKLPRIAEAQRAEHIHHFLYLFTETKTSELFGVINPRLFKTILPKISL